MRINHKDSSEFIKEWQYVLDNKKLSLYYLLNQIRPKGKIVYEYNPFRNLRLSQSMDSSGLRPGEPGYNSEDENLLEPGTLVDMDTELLNFSLNHPVSMIAQPSYDGSVNLVLNDNYSKPKLINSRFTVRENNTYEIIDRVGNNDVNLYDESQFDSDTSLYKRVTSIPTIEFLGITYNGVMPVGNYTFYFKLSDLDGNETDFVGESGMVSCYIGNLNSPSSIRGGTRDESSGKEVLFQLTNVDTSYDYVKVYYTRNSSAVDGQRIVSAARIEQKYPVVNGISNINVTGNEQITEIPITDINTKYFVVDRAKAQAACQNMLFLGNVSKPDMLYSDLQDLSLRILPYYISNKARDFIGSTDFAYADDSSSDNKYEYYNVFNIYNRTGYWNEEIYRLGIVYIMPDDTLSPVFNIRGRDGIPSDKELSDLLNIYSDDNYSIEVDGERKHIKYDENTYLLNTGSLENVKGVVRIKDTSGVLNVYGIGVGIPTQVLEYLSNKVKGFFLVRQKRIPTILCQALTMGFDKCSNLPLIKYNNNYIIESFLNSSGYLTQEYLQRLITVGYNTSNETAICPEYELRQSYFNNLFTGTDFPVRAATVQTNKMLYRNPYNDRQYYLDSPSVKSNNSQYSTVQVTGIPDNTPIVKSESNNTFRARAGEAEEGWKFRTIERKSDLDIDNGANRAIRGVFGSYIGISKYNGDANTIINIYVPGYNEGQMSAYFKIRYEDASAYYAVSDRFGVVDAIDTSDIFTSNSVQFITEKFYRGDCYICNYTHRVNRNFSDPDAPTNDEIVDDKTFRDNYDKDNKENLAKINRGDVNAIQLGSWVTFKVCASSNLSLRDVDKSYPTEEGLYGTARTFYPLSEMSVDGAFKLPESSVINGGYGITTSERLNFRAPDVPYIKNVYQTRILYSDVAVTDSFKNGYRVFQLTHYRDYPSTYGGIMKLVELFGNILCIFEHGIALIPVNERAVAGEGSGGNVFINTSNVLPENPKMLSDTYGTQWPESVVQTPYFVYGVDTVGKKIWRTNGDQFEIISDFKIQEFLNENITLSERELTPVVGVRNVKGHYNAFKQDVMFTFYDNLYGFEEKAWNICYNEVMQKFVTFYSWIPSYSANIDNIHFSFNRDTSKWISKLGTSSAVSSSADGVVLDNVVFTKDKMSANIVGLVNRPMPNKEGTGLPTVDIKYSLEKDNFGNRDKFDLTEGVLSFNGTYEELTSKTVWQLNIRADVTIGDYEGTDTSIKQYVSGWKEFTETNAGYYQSVVAVTSDAVINNPLLTEDDKKLPDLTTDFWKHGQSGIIDIKDKIKPCYWYGKQHPFEYEFVVVDNPATHKIFENLQIVSNKAVPDSFHYEVVGESYEFHEDKKNMYIRQEATKDFYQYNGSDILYNRNFLDLRGKQRDILRNWKPTGQKVKSTMFPLYYARVDTFNEIEDYYKGKTAPNKDYVNLSGSEIVYNEKLDEFRVWTHAKAADIKDPRIGRLRGNMNYQGDVWNIQINPIIFVQRNEPAWNTAKLTKETIDKVPISVGNSPIPNDLKGFDITSETPVEDYMPQDLIDLGYGPEDIDTSDWWSGRKEARLRDKYIKIRVRYTGEELAIITALKTLYTISYA
mgnify:FL=1